MIETARVRRTMGMPAPKGQELRDLQSAIKYIYFGKTQSQLKFQKGEKPRIVKAFSTFCLHAKESDPAKKREMLSHFCDFMEEQASKWIQWQQGDRLNFFGFLFREDDMKMFLAKRIAVKAINKGVAGATSKDEWDF